MPFVRAASLAIALVLALLVPVPAGAADPGSLSGRVTDAQARGVGARITVYPSDHRSTDSPDDYVTETWTDPGGSWRIEVDDWDLWPGEYLLRFDPDGSAYDPRWYRAAATPELATPVTAAYGVELAGLNVVVPARTFVSGRVLTSTGIGEPRAEVAFFPATTTSADDLWDPVASTRTDDAGTWKIASHLFTPGRYKILVTSPRDRFKPIWFRAAATPETAAAITITPGVNRPGLDIRLPAPGTVTGRVTAIGTPLADATVTAVSDSDWRQYRATTDDRGNYTLAGLSPGRYRVSAGHTSLRLPTVWFGGALDLQDARMVSVASGATTSSVSLRLSYLPTTPGRERKGPKPPKRLKRHPVDPVPDYQGQTRCKPKPKPGTRAFAAMLADTYGTTITTYMARDCAGDTSEHYDGRAIDWMVDSELWPQKRMGDSFVKWLIRKRKGNAGAMARRLGVMYIIWRDRSWSTYSLGSGWRPYSNCSSAKMQREIYDTSCHRDHVHISLTWDGALRRTSWWKAARY